MVLHRHLIVTAIVIKAKVVAQKGRCLNLRGFKAKEIHLLVVLNLDFLVICEAGVAEKLEGLAAWHREMGFVDTDGG